VSITVKILKRAPGGRPTLYATRDLDRLPVSIGRDPACTIALEDPNKHMSRFHVEIAEAEGVYWMSVVSKVNPVMVKGVRYGPGTRLTLQSGDSFDLADYEVQVLLPDKAQPPRAAEPPPDKAERLFNEATFVGVEAPAPRPVAPPPKAEPPPEETFIPGRPAHPLRALFEGAGLPPKELTPIQADRMLRDCGAILRAAVQGITMLLAARGELAPRDNNPLNLISNAREALEFLLDPSEDRTDGVLGAVQAVGDACEDIRSHQAALTAGLRAAVLGALARLDPAAIEGKLERGFSLASRKAQLWDAFVEQQAKLSREAQADFNQAFGRDFTAAYQAELQRLKGRR
jgi:FHA domain-containing protein/type VI secretion system protein